MSNYSVFLYDSIKIKYDYKKIIKRLLLIVIFMFFIRKITLFKPVNYNQERHIDNSYQVIGIFNKYTYIQQHEIAKKSNMNEFELVFEWEWHNIIYYLDIFRILDSHTKDVDFG